MAGIKIDLPADSISMSARMADALLHRGDGDITLLYLYLLRCNGMYDPADASNVLHWEQERLDSALYRLQELDIHTGTAKPEKITAPPKEEEVPEYSRFDLAQAIRDKQSDFPALVQDVQVKLGKTLTDRELKMLLELHDHLSMPAEVLMMLVDAVCRECVRKHGNGRKPTMGQIRTTAYRWKNAGIDTLEETEAYLNRVTYMRSQEGKMLSAVGITGRKALEDELNFLHQWMEWGFSPQAVALAYRKSIMKTSKMSWPYCHAILMSWHRKGLHDPEEIQKADPPIRPNAAPKQTTGGANPTNGKRSIGPEPAVPMTDAQKKERERSLKENQRQLQRILDSLPKK